ncbi:unnamed protein product [Lymnaea stagnalis]|uniref:Uncharacterized protein n=1 Tax=Lymnaea stagnalis TaxID=6523 RepID=A0AAV2HDX7_LYMST
MMLRLLTVLAAFLATIETASIVKRAPGDCYVNGYTFKDGQPFKISGFPPCIEYFCRSGQFNLIKEGCGTDNNTVCHDVNSTWVKQCRTWTCSKSFKDGYTYYSTSIIATKCPDDNGACFEPGDVFTLTIKNTTYSNCSCTTTPNSTVYTTCYTTATTG